jgi:hypothetical protein
MKNTKKATGIPPKNIQLTFITLSAIAVVIQVIFYIGLLARIYPNGLRLSQFSFMAFSSMMLPVILFAVAYYFSKRSASRFDRVFHAALLAVIGLAILRIIYIFDRVLAQHTDLYTSDLFVNGGMLALPIIATLALYTGLLYVLRIRDKKSDGIRSLQLATVSLAALVLIADTILNISDLVVRHIGSKNAMNFITHPDLILPIVLPFAFFAVAYLTIQKTNTLNRLFISTIYAIVGVMTIYITITLFNIGTWMLSTRDTVSVYALDLPTIIAAFLSLTVYTFLLVTHNRAKKTTKKSK